MQERAEALGVRFDIGLVIGFDINVLIDLFAVIVAVTVFLLDLFVIGLSFQAVGAIVLKVRRDWRGETARMSPGG